MFGYKSIADSAAREELRKRIDALGEVPASWRHSMSAQQILPHMADAIRVGLGKKKAARSPLHRIFGKPFLKKLALALPWPPGIPAPPEFLQGQGGTPARGFEEDKATLKNLMFEMSQVEATAQLAEHPVFLELSVTQWQELMWRHIDHHLWQFGV